MKFKKIAYLFVVLSVISSYACQSKDDTIDLNVLIVEDPAFPPVLTDHFMASLAKANLILNEADIQLNVKTTKRATLTDFIERLEKSGLSEEMITESLLSNHDNNPKGLTSLDVDTRYYVQEMLESITDKDLSHSKLDDFWYLCCPDSWYDFFFEKVEDYNLFVVNFPIIERFRKHPSKYSFEYYYTKGLGDWNTGKIVMSYAPWYAEKKFLQNYYNESTDYYITNIIIHETIHANFGISDRPLYLYDVMNPLYSNGSYFQVKPRISDQLLTEINSMRNYKRAKKLIDQGKLSRARKILDEALSLMPDNLNALELRSVIFGLEEHIEEQKALNEEIAELRNQKHSLEEIATRISVYLGRAVFEKNNGNYEKAIPLYEKVLIEDFETLFQKKILADYLHRTLLDLSDIYSQQNDCNNAISNLQTLLKYWSDDSEAIYIMGMCHFKIGNAKEAMSYLEDFLVKNPEGIKAETARIFLNKIGNQDSKRRALPNDNI